MFWPLFTGTMRPFRANQGQSNAMKIVADENMPGLALLESLGELVRVPGRKVTAAEVADADILLVRSVTGVDAALLAGSTVRFVGSATIGTDHVDLDALAQAGIRFAHAPGCNATAVAEYVLQAALHWALERGQPLAGCCVAVVGVGNVGSRVLGLMAALGCRVLPFDPPRQRAGEVLPWPWADWASVMQADVISLHVPLADAGEDATRHLLDASALEQFRAHQLLVNTCRGPVIDNAALEQRLAAPQPPAVVLDVWEQEPLVPASLLERVLLGSPHVAGYSLEGKLRGSAQVLATLFDWLGTGARPPEVQAPPGEWQADVLDERDLLALLRSRYDLREDFVLLQQAVSGETPAEDFDRLRRDYRVRHEMAGVEVSGRVADSLRQLLSLLGVQA